MSAFNRLDPLVQHHIVNTLGWRELRPLQEASIDSVLRGDDCLLLAPTAGGKTESAMFPLLSRMCSERWDAPSIVYICPLKALINNLGERLDRYTRMLGRRCAVWHGDIGQSERRQVRFDPPDVLLTTPESLEAMLISANAEMRAHLKFLRAVVVDEIHAFAGDDRGWHLVSVLERLTWSAGHPLQRVGLSATVGNPTVLLDWLAAKGTNRRNVVQPPTSRAVADADVVLDFVGSLENAAVVISRLHLGEKRLVFCDSRSRVEQLAGMLRGHGIDAYVSHSSLSASERRRAEEAFARGEDCVIVATSTLELGIDVGDLDRVIQIDSPTRVASFLQRLGRTGRRSGSLRNCLFLCTTDDSLLQAAALLNLWESGYVEPIIPPPLPYHIIAQQAMALCLQNGGIGRVDLIQQLSALPPAYGIERRDFEEVLIHLERERLLESDGTRFFMGEAGEKSFGRRHFLELLSVFTSAPVLTVTDGRADLGTVEQTMFTGHDSIDGKLLSLGGRGWRVERIDWRERRVYVTAAETPGKSTWFGSSRGLSTELCQAVKAVLITDQISARWSKRSVDRLCELRNEYPFLRPDGTSLVSVGSSLRWWTFAGESVNDALAQALNKGSVSLKTADDYGLTFSEGQHIGNLEAAINTLSLGQVFETLAFDEAAERELKFSICVPRTLLNRLLKSRQFSESDLSSVLSARRYQIQNGKHRVGE